MGNGASTRATSPTRTTAGESSRRWSPSTGAAAKSGLLGLTKALAREAAFLLARSGRLTDDTIGITVNAVTPGLVATEILDHIFGNVLDRLTAQIPVRRLGRPEEVARVVHFLAADASSYITGQVWAVNGGMDM